MIDKIAENLRTIYLNRIFYRFNHRRGVWRVKNTLDRAVSSLAKNPDKPKFDLFKEDWDNLLILDACRLDLYKEVTGKSRGRTSLGSSTAEFVEKNFSEGDFTDIVYVTGNPHFSQKIFRDLTGRGPEDVFHEVFHTYKSDWSKEEGTVLPEPLIRDAKTAKKLFPGKKIVVHFMQPHHPFLHSDIENDDAKISQDSENIWSRLAKGEFSSDEIWEEYCRNLEFVSDEIEELVKELEGRTVITSDHGNALGENSFYGHPKGVNTKELREVPWHVLDD